MSEDQKQRFIIAGLGNRGRDSFATALLGAEGRGMPSFPQKAEIVAFADANTERANVANAVLGVNIPVYATVPEAAGKHAADWLVIATPDFTHAEVAKRGLDAGLNIVIDKPLATSVWECSRIIDAGARNNRKIIVGHNRRYNEYMLAMARLVRSGAIGRVVHVEAAEVLSLSHGGSYFHRWHSEFDKSAGLVNHKCCHDLDILNWLMEDSAVGVSALGERTYYVPRPDLDCGERCSQCPITSTCPHLCDVDASDQRYRRMYCDVEHVDGYIRDRCVFTDRHTINDHEVLNIRYSKGATATFSMVAFAPREYSYIFLTGTEGRLEYTVTFDATTTEAGSRGLVESGLVKLPGEPSIKRFRPNGAMEEIPVEKLHEGYGHGGADVKLIGSILGVEVAGVDPIQRATPEQARDAVAIADMASRSIADGGRYVTIDETGRDYPPAPPSAPAGDA